MIKVNRLGNNWVSTTDPETNELILVHLDSLKQEAVDPINPSAVIATFSYYRRKQPAVDEVVKPTEADLASAKRHPDEVVLLMDMADGTNPVRLADTVMQVLCSVMLGTHPPMTYAEYTAWLTTQPRTGRVYYADTHAASPTGRFAVWQVTFTRVFGLNEDGLFVKQSAIATYRFGYMGGAEVFPGTIYNFPAGFILTREIEATSFVGLLTKLLEVASNSSDPALTEPYWVKQ